MKMWGYKLNIAAKSTQTSWNISTYFCFTVAILCEWQNEYKKTHAISNHSKWFICLTIQHQEYIVGMGKSIHFRCQCSGNKSQFTDTRNNWFLLSNGRKICLSFSHHCKYQTHFSCLVSSPDTPDWYFSDKQMIKVNCWRPVSSPAINSTRDLQICCKLITLGKCVPFHTVCVVCQWVRLSFYHLWY